ncbi:MAG TPA: hypothetical protein VH019_07875 [Rhizomicrobium sp.]|nr:hypothetical protein [Rhizomicrobium sp.]
MGTLTSILAVLGVGSIVAAFIGWRASISNHRQAWINALRDDLATFLRDLETIHVIVDRQFRNVAENVQNEEDRKAARVAILFVYWRIVLRLNRRQKPHTDLRDKLDALMTVASRTPDRTKIEDAIDLARQVLKREWDVTKYGSMATPIFWFKEAIHGRAGRSMNWAKGLFRLWIVIAIIWIAGTVIISNPVQIYNKASAPVRFTFKENTLEFPGDTSLQTAKGAVATFIRQYRAKQPKNVFDQFDQTPEQETASVIGNYQPKSALYPILWMLGAAVVPPLFLVVLALVMSWVVKGFRPLRK